jgi:hypothetical protein
MDKASKGHGLRNPWWFVPLFFIANLFVALKEWIRRKRKGDPHDISGEPSIPEERE